MAIRLDKPWRDLTSEAVAALPGQLGVFELGDETGTVVFIGRADSRSLFGLRGELEAQLGKAKSYRLEITTAYQTRWRELMMAHHADHGRYPAFNEENEHNNKSNKLSNNLGRLSPEGRAG